MIYPPSSGAIGPTRSRPGRGKSQPVVRWKQRNVQEGLVLVDEQQLSRLIKRDPIEQYYELDPEPFATGLFASVRRCRSRDTGQHFAAKFSSRARYGDDCSAEIHHEIALLSLCAPSPRIVRLHDVFETGLEIIIVLEFAPGGDLQTIIDDNLVPFESDVVKFVRQLVEGLAYLHERKIAHLDIKPQNLVMMADFPDCDVKLCDFEISRVILEGTEIREILGTPDYVAPEILHYEPITLAADMWSLGVTTYVLLTGFSPFGGETDQETFCNISRAQLDFPEELFDGVSEDARDFIRCLLVRDPSARPTAKECLRHHWFSSHKSLSSKSVSSIVNSSDPLKESSSASQTVRNNQKSLRKYLSKSREALFERVVQQQQNQKNSSLRKTTLLSQYQKTRLCESQMSLVSKSRERLLMGDQLMMSPSFSRSKEKLYGLRSLSRSHEVLDLCKGVGGVATATATPGILRSLTRATTADLSMLPFWRQQKHLACSGSSTTSIPSSLATEYNASRQNSVEDMNSLTQSSTLPVTEGISSTSKLTGSKIETTSTLGTISSLNDDINNIPKLVEVKADTFVMQNINLPLKEDSNSPKENGTKHVTVISPLLSPTLLKLTANNQPKISLEQAEKTEVEHVKTSDIIIDNFKFDMTSYPSHNEPSMSNIDNPVLLAEHHSKEGPQENPLRSEIILPSGEDHIKDTFSESHNDKDSKEKVEEYEMNISDSGSDYEDIEDIKKNDGEEVEDEEPRYTVAQLVSAFNKHQEVITKTSLEVTMTTSDKSVDRSHFPIGPNALRLFIPDIDISADERPQHRKKHRKPGKEIKEEECTDCTPQEHMDNLSDSDSKLENDNSMDLLSNTDLLHIDNNIVQQDIVDGNGRQTINNQTLVVQNVDNTNNNNVDNLTMVSICQLVIESPNSSGDEVVSEQEQNGEDHVSNKLHLSVDVVPQYMRSGSLSSDASLTPGTPSETAMSWEELAMPSGTKQQQRRRSSGATADPAAGGLMGSNSSWGRVCTGSYTRAMEKFGGKASGESEQKLNRKSLTLLTPSHQNSNEKTRRKSSPVIKSLN